MMWLYTSRRISCLYSDDVAVHVKKNFLFIQQIPNIEGYLRLMLDGFFKTARKLDLEIEKMKMQEGNG